MRRFGLVSWIIICCNCLSIAQQQNDDAVQAVSFAPVIPISSFSGSHSWGGGLSYSRLLAFSKKDSSQPSLRLLVAAGGDYYFGKNKTVAGYPFKYGGLFHLNLMAGPAYQPAGRTSVSLAAGPVLAIYEETSYLVFGTNFHFDYRATDNMRIGPGVYYRKEKNADALWALAIRASYIF